MSHKRGAQARPSSTFPVCAVVVFGILPLLPCCSSHSRACQLVHRLCCGSHSGHARSSGTVPCSRPKQVQGQPSVTEQLGGQSIWCATVSWEASQAQGMLGHQVGLEQEFFHSTPVPRQRPCRMVLVSLLQPRPQTAAVHEPVGPVDRVAVGPQDARSRNGAKKMRSWVGSSELIFAFSAVPVPHY